MSEKKSVFDRNPILTLIIFFIFISFLLDISFTHIYKIYNSHKSQAQQIVDNEIRIKHPVYHHTFKANSNANLEHSVLKRRWNEKTNSLGFKDNKIREIALDSDKERVIFIGDSITEGLGYTFDETFVGIIAKQLNKQGIEVLNASRVSYSPIIYWRKIKYLIEDVGLKFDEVIVLIDLSDVQDEAEVYKLDINQNVIDREKSKAYLQARELVINGDDSLPFASKLLIKNFLIKARYLISENTTLVYFMANKIYDYTFDETTRVPYLYLNPDYTRFSWPYYQKAYDQYAEEGIKNSINYMNLLSELLKQNDIKLTVGVYPLPNNIWFDNIESKHVKIWKDWTQKENVNFYNLFPELVDQNRSIKEKKSLIDRFYIKYDMHFNKDGHKLFASDFLDFYNDK